MKERILRHRGLICDLIGLILDQNVVSKDKNLLYWQIKPAKLSMTTRLENTCRYILYTTGPGTLGVWPGDQGI